MSILGIDYGSSKIGLAKSDDTKSLALPLEILKNTTQDEVLEYIKNFVAENNIDQIVVGVPVSLPNQDEPSQQMQEVLDFIDFLKQNLDIVIETEDERLSTKMAGSMTQNSKPEDDVSAMLILQSYLDKNKGK